MTTPNAALAYRVLDHIDAHPEQWKQGVYIGKAECGTAACFAGWTVLLSNAAAEPRFYPGCDSTADVVVGGRGRVVPDLAEELLRASRWVEAGDGYSDDIDLFDQDNTREDLGRLVAEIFGPRPEHCGYSLPHPAHDWVKLADDERPQDQDARCPGGEPAHDPRPESAS
jgi:hypothetical protein